MKLTEVIGKKLDPNSRYLFLFDGNTPYEQIEHFSKEANRVLGHSNFFVSLTNGDPKKKFSVYEIKEPITKPTKKIPVNFQPDNSLIHIMPTKSTKPIDYESPFPSVLKDGGFDRHGILLEQEKETAKVFDRGTVNSERSENEA
jgi:hypothetical protein